MKISLLSLAATAALLATVSAASASTYTVDSTATEYSVIGSLSKDTEITFTYTDTSSPGNLLTLVGQETSGGTNETAAAFASSSTKTATDSAIGSTVGGLLSVLTTANFDGKSLITIENLSNKTVSFSALFAATRLAAAGGFTTNGPSEVPLPPAFLLFATGLMVLAGMAMVRKAHDQA